jgi:hypothetical protein
MPRYELRTTQRSIFDGQLVPENTVIGVLETELPTGNVLSAAALGSVVCQKIDEAKTVAVIARQEPAFAGVKKVVAEDAVVDPDSLNAEDLAADAAEEAEEAARLEAEAAAKSDDTEKAEPEHTLDGLDTRIAKALARQNLTSREEIEAFIAEGKDLEDDLEDIGKVAKKKIQAWLES